MKIAFSIITVTYNSKKDLLKTIKSVQSQSYSNYKHIIKDGLSVDKTNEINFSAYKNTLFYESKDIGIYDAMNQSIKYVKNEYIIYLNSGDTFFSKFTLEKLAINIENNPLHNSYIGGTLQIDVKKKLKLRLMGIGLLYKYLPFAQLPHPSFVIKKSVLDKLDLPFDPKLKISSDYKQQIILRKNNLLKICYLEQIISLMPVGGISNKSKISILKGYRETFIFSFKILKFISIYIIILKIILNLYSRYSIKKVSNLILE